MGRAFKSRIVQEVSIMRFSLRVQAGYQKLVLRGLNGGTNLISCSFSAS